MLTIIIISSISSISIIIIIIIIISSSSTTTTTTNMLSSLFLSSFDKPPATHRDAAVVEADGLLLQRPAGSYWFVCLFVMPVCCLYQLFVVSYRFVLCYYTVSFISFASAATCRLLLVFVSCFVCVLLVLSFVYHYYCVLCYYTVSFISYASAATCRLFGRGWGLGLGLGLTTNNNTNIIIITGSLLTYN